VHKIFLPVICAIAVTIGFLSLYFVPFQIAEPQTVIIRSGASLDRIGKDLAERQVIKSALLFKAMTRFQGKALTLQAGEYQFIGAFSMYDVARRLGEGDVVLHSLSLVEGQTRSQFLSQLQAIDFLDGDIDNAFGEGWLLPDTYRFERGTQRQFVFNIMNAAMVSFLEDAWDRRADGLPFGSPEEALVLASIVEKETAIAEERGLVASVFINRLNKNMRLQSDPTIVYGLTNGEGALGRPIRKSEIRQPHSHNTYVIKGLPPTPIGYPGRASILAVLNPLDSPYYYFVADGSGGHVFAETLAEHNLNVRKWRANR